MTLYRDLVIRISAASILAGYRPRARAALTSVRLEHDGHVADVELVRVPAPGLPSGWRSALRCPACGQPANVLGCVPPGYDVKPGWQCPRCGAWRGRPRRYPAELPTQLSLPELGAAAESNPKHLPEEETA